MFAWKPWKWDYADDKPHFGLVMKSPEAPYDTENFHLGQRRLFD